MLINRLSNPITRRTFLARAFGSVAAAAIVGNNSEHTLAKASAASGATPVSATVLAAKQLRGYGTLSAVFRPGMGPNGPVSVTHISCESPQKAMLVQAKYLSDLTTLPGTQTQSVSADANSILAQVSSSGGAVATFALGTDVIIFAASYTEDLSALCASSLTQGFKSTDFQPRVSVPMYLDRFDRHGLISYYALYHSPPHKATDPPYDFTKDFDFAAENNVGLILWMGEGRGDTQEGSASQPFFRWAADECRARNIPLHMNTSWGSALWLTNRYRDQMMQMMPQYNGTYYQIDDPTIARTGSVSWNATTAKDVELGVFQQIVKDFSSYPNIVGWLEPHAETDSPPASFLVEYGAVADQGYQRFLQTRYSSLSALSSAWFGNPIVLETWDEVKVPEFASFLGWSENAMDLTGDWRVLYTQGNSTTESNSSRQLTLAPAAPSGWDQPTFDDSSWGTQAMPGNQAVAFFPKTPVYARRIIDVSAGWLSSHPKVWLYVWDLNRANAQLLITINGVPTSVFKLPPNAAHSGVVEVASLLKPGANIIALCLPEGFLGYRCYISGDPPLQYPQLGTGRNQQWVDFVDWSRWTRGNQIRRGAEMIRQVDPDRPINFMHPDFYSDHVLDICADYGGQFHNTGYAGAFWAEHNPLICRSAGRPATAEPGGPASSAAEFKAYWGRWITEGLNAVHYFLHLGDITWHPDILEVFNDNRAMYETIGKYHVPKAEVAVLYGQRSNSLTGWPWGLDPNSNLSGGYWAWNTASPLRDLCPRDGIMESAFSNGTADKYRVIFDSNTSVVDDDLLGEIETWVRNGGTFITYVQTGRHTTTEFNSWPISRLTGYDVIGISKYDANGYASESAPLKLAPGQTILKSSLWNTPVAGSGLSLRKNASDCEDLLLWANGTVAAGMRPLGRGKILHLGCHFEHLGDRNDAPNTQALFGYLIDYLHVTRVPGRADGVIFRHFISNTGLFDIWALYNDTETDVTTDLIFTGIVPQSALDLQSQLPIDITTLTGVSGIYRLHVPATDLRMFRTPRQDVASSPLTWLNLQRDWWAGTKSPVPRVLPSPADDQRYSVDLTNGWAFKPVDGMADDRISALTAVSADDSQWEVRNLGIWTLPDHPDVKHALLRKRFTVPSTWNAGETQLWVQSEQPTAFLDQGRVYLDGKLLQDFMAQGVPGTSLTDALVPGSEHVLALEVQGVGVLVGCRGNAWIYHIPDAPQKMDLGSTWDLTNDGIHDSGPIALPGPFNGMFASRKVTIDAAQSHKNAVVYMDVDGPIYGLLVNGRMVVRGRSMLGNTFLLNVTCAITYGEENHFELITRTPSPSTKIHAIELRFYDKGVYP